MTYINVRLTGSITHGTHLSDVCLQAFDAIQPQHKPQLEGPELSTKWNFPVLESNNYVHICSNSSRNGSSGSGSGSGSSYNLSNLFITKQRQHIQLFIKVHYVTLNIKG